MTATGVGLVGAGRVAALHVAALRRLSVPVVGVVASTARRSAAAAERLGIDASHTDLDALLDDPRVDSIHVTTPTALHADQVEQVLRAGKHVVCEKPLSVTAAESVRLVQLAEERQLVGAVCYTYRFHPVVPQMRSRVRGLGRLGHVRASYLQEWLLDAPAHEWRLDPDRAGPSRALADIGSHVIDLIEFVTGHHVSAVAATIDRAVSLPGPKPGTGDDVAVVLFELEGAGIGSFQVSQVAVGRANSLTLEIHGTLGSAALDLEDTTRLWHAPRGGIARFVDVGPVRPMGEVDGTDFPPTGTIADHVSAYAAFVRAVRRTIAGEQEHEFPTFRDCLRTHAVRDAIIRSARERVWVDAVAAELVEPAASDAARRSARRDSLKARP